MRKILFLIISVQLLLSSCATRKADDPNLAILEKVENGLVPFVKVKGEQAAGYNIHERMRYYKVPGLSIAFLNNGKIVWAKGYGYTCFDSLNAVDENTLFQAASISKPVAAMAALTLVEEGKIGLDNDVNEYLSGWKVPENEFTRTEKVTLRRLLTHSAGLTVHGFGGYASNEKVPLLIQILNGEPPANSDAIIPDIVPGTQNRYSGGGYTVMQKILIDVTDKLFPEIMEKRVLSKAGMKNSTYMQPLPVGLQSNAARGHSSDGSMIDGKWHTYPEMAAAGLWTTPTDLLKYAMDVQRSLAGEPNHVLSQEMTREMLKKQIDSQGLGPGVRGEGDSLTFGHGGSNAGYRCQLLAFAQIGQGVAIMTNSDNGMALATEILRSFSNACGWSFYKPVIKSIYPIGKEKLAEYAGLYQYDQKDLNAEISVSGDHLTGLQLWDSLSFEMYPEANDLFFNKEDGSSFEFKSNDQGRVTEVIIQKTYRFVKIR